MLFRSPIMDVYEHQAPGAKKEERNDVPEYEQQDAQPKEEAPAE